MKEMKKFGFKEVAVPALRDPESVKISAADASGADTRDEKKHKKDKNKKVKGKENGGGDADFNAFFAEFGGNNNKAVTDAGASQSTESNTHFFTVAFRKVGYCQRDAVLTPKPCIYKRR